jgi:hypothetical protein
VRRRELLADVGTAAVAGLAGCLGLGPCASAPDEPRRLETTVRDEQRVTLAHEGCPTLRNPAPHYTVVANRRASSVAAEVDIDLADGGALFRGRFRLRPDATAVLSRPEPAGYVTTVRIPSLDWQERYEAVTADYTCNETAQRVSVGSNGVDAQVTRTTVECGGLL